MKQYLNSEQTAKLIALGFDKADMLRWLREEKALHIQITLWEKGWYNDIWAFEYHEEEKKYSARQIHQSTDFDTYELALEDALKYALENLI